MSTKKTSPYVGLTDEELIEKFYKIPIFKLITNVLVFAVFITAFIIISVGTMKESTLVAVLVMILGAALTILSRSLFSSEKRREIAEEMMRRYQRNGVNSPYVYLFERELALTGKIKERSPSKIIGILSVVFGILNYLFSLLSALIAILFSLIPLVLAVFCALAYIVLIAARANGAAAAMLSLARYSFIPLKLSFKFLTVALIPNIKMESLIADASAVMQAETNRQPSKMEAELKINKYLSLNGFVPPPQCGWEGNISAAGSTVYVEGALLIAARDAKEMDCYVAVEKAKRDLADLVNPQIEAFLKDYPTAEHAKLVIEVRTRIC